MIINTNMGSSVASRILSENTGLLQKSLKRLSTGSKIASISDDVAGVAVATKFNAQVSRLSASGDNVKNMISFAQTQDSYLASVAGALERMSEIATLATDETKNASDLAHYGDEFTELMEYLRSAIDKDFNGISLFSGNSQTFTTSVNSQVSLEGANLSSSITALTNTGAVSYFVTSQAEAYTALAAIETALGNVAANRADIGSNLSRLEAEYNSLSKLRDNISAARSRITDVDVAEESANFAKQQILVQSGTAMLAQANILPQSALRLIN
jgi:flagellin